MLGLKLGFSASKKHALNLDISSDLQAFWKFAEIETNTTSDSSGNDHTAMLYNMDRGNFALRGNSSLAFNFNGTDERAQTSSFNSNSTQCTWTYWLYLPDVTQGQYTRTFQTGTNANTPDNGVSHELNQMGLGNNVLAFVHWNNNSAALVGRVTLPLEEWVHIAHVVDGNSATIYINGVEELKATVSRGVSNEVICIAAGDQTFTECGMDEIRIYNRALSSSDINGLYTTDISLANIAPAINETTYYNSALDQVGNNTGHARILCVGDSLTFGSWSTGDSSDNNQKQFSYPAYLRNLFLADGTAATEENFIGWGGNIEYNIEHDERLSYTGTPEHSEDWTIGGGAIQLRSGESITFSPNDDIDTFKVYTLGYNTAGALDIKVDGIFNQTIDLDTGADNELFDPVIINTGSLGIHSITLEQSGSGNAFIYGVEAYDSSKNQITIFNTGAPSAKATDWNTIGKPWSPINSWGYFDPDLTLICLGANEWISGDNVQTYQNALASLIEGILAEGEINIALVIPPPSNESSYSNQAAYRNALNILGVLYKIAVIDIYIQLLAGRWQVIAQAIISVMIFT